MENNRIWTIKDLIVWTTDYFRRHHIESSRLDAELLLAHVLKKTRIFLYTDFDLIVNPSELAQFREYVKKRVGGYSTAAIIGEKEFMGLSFYVNPDVLIPRADTETWLEKVIQYHKNEAGLRVADLGTGSGAILLSFLYYCRESSGVGVDISEKALDTAQKNGEILQLNGRAEWRRGNFLEALREGECFDGILSNPPYIPSKDIDGLDEEVKNEPHLALDGGEDGLDFYRILAEKVSSFLKPGGFLALEFGIRQADSVYQLLKDTGDFDSFEIIRDYGGIDRAVYCRKKS